MRILILIALIMLIGCSGASTTPGIPDERCMTTSFDLNEKGEIIVYLGDYTDILNYRCEDCHSVEHRP